MQGDVSTLADLDRLFATILEQKGRLDILFANAGLGEFVPLGQITEAHFDKTFGGNVKGTLIVAGDPRATDRRNSTRRSHRSAPQPASTRWLSIPESRRRPDAYRQSSGR